MFSTVLEKTTTLPYSRHEADSGSPFAKLPYKTDSKIELEGSKAATCTTHLILDAGLVQVISADGAGVCANSP